jgi:hypothetical protein
MLRNVRHAALAALPLTVLSFYAIAQSTSPPAPGAHASFFQRMLQKMDTNGDGRIRSTNILPRPAPASEHRQPKQGQHRCRRHRQFRKRPSRASIAARRAWSSVSTPPATAM